VELHTFQLKESESSHAGTNPEFCVPLVLWRYTSGPCGR